jgi:hypothetical protein
MVERLSKFSSGEPAMPAALIAAYLDNIERIVGRVLRARDGDESHDASLDEAAQQLRAGTAR